VIDFDLSRRPSRPLEWVALAEAIRDADELDESQWLEFKSQLDWSNAAHLANLSRAILGLANRDPALSRRTLEGRSIVSIGLAPGVLQGVERIDPADLDAKLRPYLGEDGPRWEPHWIRLAEVDVLIVEVDAPQVGDPPYSLRRGSSNMSESQIFVRELGRTVPASQLQLNALARRFVADPAVETLDVHVGVTLDAPISSCFWEDEDIEVFLAMERRDLEASLDEPDETADRLREATSAGGLRLNLEAATALSELRPESRTRDVFLAEVAAYIHELRATLPHALDEFALSLMSAPKFWITNHSPRNFRDVEVSLAVHGDARAADPDDYDDSVWRGLPPRPRKFGPYRVPTAFARAMQAPVFTSSFASPTPFIGDYTPSRRSIENGGSFRVELDGVDLRPLDQEVEIESDLVVVVPRARREPVIVRWRATASNVDAVASGESELPIAGPSINLFAAARQRGFPRSS
jgi:hypothetical protein